jgi:F-type H+-transporting ATPase subunit c
MLYLFGVALAVGFGVSVAVIGAGLGQGRVGAAAMEAMARQPEALPRIQLAMIIAMALLESLAIYALLIAFMILLQKWPDSQGVMQIIQASGGR